MNIISPIKISYKYLLAAKFRSFLTILGIIIGVGSVIVIMAIGQSAQSLILGQISGVGSDLIGVLPGASDDNSPPPAAMGVIIKTLQYDDLEVLADGKTVPEISSGAGYVVGTETAEYEGTSLTASFVGTTSGYIDTENTEMEKGRFISKEEEASLSRVAVIGTKLAKDLFADDDPIGKRLKLKDQNFSVIGILKERGSAGFGLSSQDDTVYIPVKSAQKLILGTDYLGFIRLKVKNADLIPQAIANVKTTLRDRHNIDDSSKDDFSVRDQASAMETVKKVTDVLRYFLLVIGAISLIVGGVGIMNIMLIAVTQRIREVGLRKAVGAKNGDVTIQFLIEAVFISLLGGIIGIIGGITMSFLISAVAKLLKYDWPLIISWQSVFIATAVSIVIGIVFGIYPARKAAKISPMEALRYE